MTDVNYSVAIRTLGKAGIAYETLIHSLQSQTIPPKSIVVYIADGFPLPSKVANEKFVVCSKGMAHQRALDYNEISSDYILLCDDDVYFSEDSVEKLFVALESNHADCISADVFRNHEMRFSTKLKKMVLYGEFPSFNKRYAFRIRPSSNYSYCNSPNVVMESQSCAGPCMLIKKDVNNVLNYQDEIWMDHLPYTSGQDQLFAYKLYRYGYKLLVHYDSGVIHLDARTGHIKDYVRADFNKRKIRYIEWYRSVYEPSSGIINKAIAKCSYFSYWISLFIFDVFVGILKGKQYRIKNSFMALKEARKYVESSEYREIPKWNVLR